MRETLHMLHGTIKKLAENRCGATAVEYALIASATALGIAAVLPSISSSLVTKFTALASSF